MEQAELVDLLVEMCPADIGCTQLCWHPQSMPQCHLGLSLVAHRQVVGPPAGTRNKHWSWTHRLRSRIFCKI